MKALFVNGSPRKNWNTHKMLEQAMKGAVDSGAEAELIHLYDYSFKGCISCFACKLKNSKTDGLCAVKDSLRPVLEKALNSDVIVVGSPVYFGYPTGVTRSFLERMMFPILCYSLDKSTGRPRLNINRTVRTAMIFTMNCPEEAAGKIGYDVTLGSSVNSMKTIFGHSEMLCAYDTYEFADYSRYDSDLFNEEAKAKHREEQFPKDLQKAYELGKRLVNMAK